MKKCLYILSFLFVVVLNNSVLAQATNTNCANPTPFCTGQTMNFPAVTGNSQAQSGPNYGCLGGQPRPTWFYMQIASAGSIVITMAAANDIDFICWGPFTSLNSCGNLTSSTQVPGSGYNNPNSNGCSFSGSPTETLTIQNAQPGQFYLLLITNWSGATQNITFQQANATNQGAANTNCGMICMVTPTNSGLVCAGNTSTISCSISTAVTSYTWFGPNSFSSNMPLNIVNPTTTTTYTLQGTATSTLLTVPTATCQAFTTVTVVQYPSFTINPTNPTICQGGSVSLGANLSPGNNPGNFTFTWQPTNGSGVFSPYSQNTVIFPPLLPTNVTLATIPYSVTVSPSIRNCPITKTVGITVNNPLTPSLTMPAPLCNIFSPVTLTASPTSGTWSGVGNNAVTSSGVFNPAIAINGPNNVAYAISIGTCIVTNTGVVSVSQFNSAALTGSLSLQCVQDPSVNLMSLVQNTVSGLQPTSGNWPTLYWSGPNVLNNSFDPAGLATGNYTMMYSVYSNPNPTVCPASTILTVPVFNPPIPVIGTIKPYCNTAQQAVLTASPSNGVWSVVSGVTANGILTPSSCAIGNNTVAYTAGIGTCVATSTANFNISRFNTAALTGTMPNLCVSSVPVNLMGIVQSTVTGIWTGPNVVSTYSFNPLGLASNTYVLNYNTFSSPDQTLCPDASTIAVAVLNPVVPSITMVGPFCNKNASVQMSVSPNTGTWTNMSYLSPTGVFSPSLANIGSNPVQYVTGNSTCNVQQTKFISVEAYVPSTIINQIPDQCVTNSAFFLQPITMNGSGTWGGVGVLGSNFNPSISGAGKYILTYSTSSMPSGLCPSHSTLAVNVFSLATPIIDKIGPLCNNSSMKQLLVTPLGGIFGGANTNAISYSGQFNPAFALIGDNIVNYSIAAGPCVAFAEATISVEKFISANFATSQKISFCQGDEPVNMDSYVINAGGLWNGFPGISKGSNMFDPANANVGDNKVEYQTFSTPNATLCPDTKTINVSVYETPKISLTRSFISNSCVPVPLTFSINSENISNLKGTAYWTIGDGSEIIEGIKISHTFTAAGVYTLASNFITDKGCKAKSILDSAVTVYETPKALFIYEPDVITTANPEVYLNNLSSNLNTNLYQWQITGYSKVYEINPKLTLPEPGLYYVTLSATSIYGCKSEHTKLIEVKNDFNVFIPSSFSPNNDGINDFFMPVFSPYGLDKSSYELEIFDRWGKTLFISNDPNRGWDGTQYNIGIDALKNESYVYKLKFKDNKGKTYYKTGNVLLIP